jgi:hypothetical protein
LLEFAKNNPGEFIRSGLSRLWPAPQKDDPDFVQNNQFNVNNLSEMESARRVAFALAKAAHQLEQEQQVVAEVSPQEPYPDVPSWRPPDDAPLLQPEPIDNLDRERWVAELPLTPEERADQKLVRETRETTLENYRGGSPAEQGGTVRHSSPDRDPRGEQRARMLARRRDQLL